MSTEPNHACDRCGETFALSAPQSGPHIEVEHFLETGCRGGVLQTGPTPMDALERQIQEFAKRMGSVALSFGPPPQAVVSRVNQTGALALKRSKEHPVEAAAAFVVTVGLAGIYLLDVPGLARWVISSLRLFLDCVLKR